MPRIPPDRDMHLGPAGRLRQMLGRQPHDAHPQLLTLRYRRGDQLGRMRPQHPDQSRYPARDQPEPTAPHLCRDADPAIRHGQKIGMIPDRQPAARDIHTDFVNRRLVNKRLQKIIHRAPFFWLLAVPCSDHGPPLFDQSVPMRRCRAQPSGDHNVSGLPDPADRAACGRRILVIGLGGARNTL